MSTAQSPLTRLGYNMVAWPKTGLRPLALLYKTTNGVSAVEANLQELFKTGDAAPPQTMEDDATDVEGSAELTFDAKAGINMLDWLLNKLHLGKLNAGVTLNESYEVSVVYRNVKEVKVSLLALDNYISTSIPATERINSFKEKLQNNELYVVNNIVKSNDIAVTISAKNGQDITTDVVVKGIIDANANVARKSNNAVELVYKTAEDKPVVFAFKAQQIIYDQQSFWNNKPAQFRIKDQVGVVLLGEEGLPTKSLKTNDEMVEW